MTPSPKASPALEIREFALAGMKLLWDARLVIGACTLVGALLGLAQAYRSPEIWNSKMLVASVQEATDEKLKGLGSLLGKNASLGGEEMELFATVLVSGRMGRKILSTEISAPDSPSVFHSIAEFIRLDTTDAKKLDKWLTGMDKRITIGPVAGKSSSILMVTMSSGKPWLARAMLRAAYDSTSAEVIRIRSARLQTQLPHLEYASQTAARDLDLLARQLVQFQATNRSVSSPEYLSRQDSLVRERQVLERKYLAIRQEVEETIINLAKMSPPCLVVDPPDLPATKSAPRRLLILLFGIVFGFTVGCGFTLGREALR